MEEGLRLKTLGGVVGGDWRENVRFDVPSTTHPPAHLQYLHQPFAFEIRPSSLTNPFIPPVLRTALGPHASPLHLPSILLPEIRNSCTQHILSTTFSAGEEEEG